MFRPRRRPFARVAPSLGLAIDLHVRRLGRPKAVVHPVAPGAIEADAIRRIGRQQGRCGSVEQPGHGGRRRSHRRRAGGGRRAARARPAGRSIGRLGELRHVVGIDETAAERLEVVLPGEVIEEGSQRRVVGSETIEQLGELGGFGLGHRRQGIERGEDQPFLVLRELDVGDGDRRLLASQRELDPQVAIDDVAGRLVDRDLGDPADLGQSSRERRLLVSRMRPPVARVRDELSRCDFAVADDPAAPGRGSR